MAVALGTLKTGSQGGMLRWAVHLEGGPRRVNHAAVAVGHKVYSFGGYCSGEDYETLRQIDVHVFNAGKCVLAVHEGVGCWTQLFVFLLTAAQQFTLCNMLSDSNFQKSYQFRWEPLPLCSPVFSASGAGHRGAVVQRTARIRTP